MYGFALLWLGVALVGLLGLLHAAYSPSRFYYVGYGVSVVAAGTLVAFLAVAVLS